MSMLAEPRRKQKWSVDPRNSSWSNDDSKFGQKMLERMGWSKGKGLGRSEQGATDHIKVKLKNNSLGLGANISHEDNWIAHQDDFNELLAQLNNCHGQSNMPEPQPDEQKGFSLEEKSKTSKKRVHYMKFTKGKDLSSRSKTDLNCIFGKRGRSTKDEEQESSRDSPSDKEESATPPCTELDTESIANTVTSTMTMQEYFAQRMAQLKKARGQASTPAAEAETPESSSPSGAASPVHSAEENTEEPKKKKKKKSKRASNEVEAVEEEACCDAITVQADGDQEPTKKKKKKKRRHAEDECPSNENSNSGAEQACEEAPPTKKKKSKKHTEDSEPTNQEQTDDSEIVHKKKKKKKCKEEADDAGQMDTEEPVEKKSKKHKKKKHQEQD